jgi:hypothetical protein
MVGGFVELIFGTMKSSGAYTGAMDRVKVAPAVVDALGTPIRDRFYLAGNINVNGTSGKADLSIPVYGPKGDATIFVIATKTLGEWHFEHLVVQIGEVGQRIDLSETLNLPNHSPDPTPASGTPPAEQQPRHG